MSSVTLRRAVLCVLGWAAVGLGAGLAHAQEPAQESAQAPAQDAAQEPAQQPAPEPDVPFEWSAPEGCPSRAEVLDGLARVLDADSTSWDRFEIVRGSIRRGERAFELALEFISGRRIERRTFATRDCADLSHAAVVALALVLDPAWEWDAEETQPVAPAKPGRETSEADEGSKPAEEVPPPPLEVAFELGPEGLIDTRTLGRSAFGLGLLARARTQVWGSRFSAELFGAWLPTQRIAVRPAESVALGLTSAGLRVCSWPNAVLALCAEGEAGRLSARGVGENAGRELYDAWVAPGASVVLESRLVRGLLLNSRVSLLAPLTRPEYTVNQTEGVHQVPAVTVRVALGLILTGK